MTMVQPSAAVSDKDRDCPVCTGADLAPLAAYSPPPWNVVQCRKCDMVYLHNPPGYEALVEDHAWDKSYAIKAQETRGSTALSPFVRWFRTNVVYLGRNRRQKMVNWFKGGKVLDVGCGPGGLLIPPLTPFGIELASAQHKMADQTMRERGGYCVHGPGADSIWEFPERFFDGIVMHSYLEHEEQVSRVLDGAHRCLKDDGAVFVRVPNFGSLNRRVIGKTWCGFRYPDHVNYFTLDTLRDVAGRAGFRVDLLNRVTLRIDDNINALLRKQQPDQQGTR